MLYGLLIGDGKGAELDPISHACDNTPSGVDYPDAPIFRAQRECTRPDDQRRHRHIGAVTDANGGMDLQAFFIEAQLSNEVLCLLTCRQRSILPEEVGFNIRQRFDCVGPPRGSWTVPVVKIEEPAAANYFVSNLGDNSTCPVADVDHLTVGMRRKSGGLNYCGGTVFQAEALPVQNQPSNAHRRLENVVARYHGLLPEKDNIRV